MTNTSALAYLNQLAMEAENNRPSNELLVGTGAVAGLDEVYDKIVSMLYLAKRRKKFKALIDRLSAKADIYINKPFLGEE